MGFLKWLTKASAAAATVQAVHAQRAAERWSGPTGKFATDRHRPPGSWSIFNQPTSVAGVTVHRPNVEWFLGAARKAESWGKPYGVRFEREPGNAADRNAVAVYGEAGGESRKIGFLPRDDAAELVNELESAGLAFAAELYSIWVSDSGYIDIKVLTLGPRGMGHKARIRSKLRTE